MNRRDALLGVGAVGLAIMGGGATQSGLSEYRWRKRLVVVFAATPTDPRLQVQRDVLAGVESSGDSRDLILIQVAGDQVAPPVAAAGDLRRRFGVSRRAFAAVLVGKDGGVKLQRKTVIDAGVLVRTIDAMPMQRAESRFRAPH